MSNVATKLPHQIDSRAKLIPDSLLVRADLTAAVHAKKGSNGGHITDILLDVSNIYGSTVNSTLGFLISTLQRCDVLPSTLHIQFDGAKANKNKVSFSTLAHFVHLSIFSTVIVHFLPSGHSHAHADRFFSVVRKVLNAEEMYTPGVHSELVNSLSAMKGVRSVRLERLSFHFKNWAEDQIGRELDGCFDSMHFLFEKKDDDVIMSHRPFGSSEMDTRTVVMMKLEGTPNWLARSTDSDAIARLIEQAGKNSSLPDEVISVWKVAKSRVENLPAPVSFQSVLDGLLLKISKRVLPPNQLKGKDQKELQAFINDNKKTRKRRLD